MPVAACDQIPIEGTVPTGTLTFDKDTTAVKMDYRKLPVGSTTAFGPVITCRRCGLRGAADIRGLRVVHVAWFDGETSIASVLCRCGGVR